jgi:hypothetical protein
MERELPSKAVATLDSEVVARPKDLLREIFAAAAITFDLSFESQRALAPNGWMLVVSAKGLLE